MVDRDSVALEQQLKKNVRLEPNDRVADVRRREDRGEPLRVIP
jgi:hypothetical protein